MVFFRSSPARESYLGRWIGDSSIKLATLQLSSLSADLACIRVQQSRVREKQREKQRERERMTEKQRGREIER